MARVMVSGKFTLVVDDKSYSDKSGVFELDDERAAALYGDGLVVYEIPDAVTLQPAYDSGTEVSIPFVQTDEPYEAPVLTMGIAEPEPQPKYKQKSKKGRR